MDGHRKRSLTAGGGLLLLALVLWLARDYAQQADEVIVSDDRASTDLAPAVDAEQVAGSDERSPIALAQGPQVQDASAVESVVRAAAPESIALRGLALRIDREGREYPGVDGSFTLVWIEDGVLVDHHVDVRAGEWMHATRTGVELYVNTLVLADMPISLKPDHFTIPANSFLTLRGLGRQGVLMHVIAADGAQALQEIEVRRAPGAFPTARQHPGAAPVGSALISGARSPLMLMPAAGAWKSDAQYYVRAPGYAWGSITVDHDRGGERTLELLAASSIEIEVLGNADWLQPIVRLWPPGTSKWHAYAFAERTPDESDRALFEGLPPGSYLASVERGWADRRVSYGQAVVDLVAGELLRVPIQIKVPERPAPVQVTGTLRLPAEWSRANLRIEFKGEGPTETWAEEPLQVALSAMQLLKRDTDGTELFAWKVQLPIQGSYGLEVFPLLVRRFLPVPADGLQDVHIEVPPAAQVEVQVIDKLSGEELSVPALHWSTPAIEEIVGTPLYTAVIDRSRHPARIRFRAPVGPIRLATIERSLDIEHGTEEFTLQPGFNLLQLRVDVLIGVHFILIDKDAEVPWSWGYRLRATRSDGKGRDVARSIGHLWFDEEGTYVLGSKGIPGYAAIDGLRFEVRRGVGIREIEVPLIRD